MQSNVATIEWHSIDLTQGPLDTRVTYTNNAGEEVTLSVAVGETTTALADYKRGSDISYFTRYRPAVSCLDIFPTATATTKIN
jgi:hypothetical protein